ncbi:MAG: hypothetical protein E6468_09035 [Varibaculum cambriense]|uniref:hypothetical protein n=1 Tax=Varibaculum cambriense TaxID=184870 RepID=UPI002908BB0B|nr:hypothetical protein [Varibaculum cambriense]MDU6681968.1 hypothetical protein [Varibaculum cambriense]
MANNFYPLNNRELISTTPTPDGGTSVFYRTSFGFETDILSPEGFLVSRGSLGPDLAPVESTSQPALVHWNGEGQVTFVSFRPNSRQVKRYFRDTSAPLTISYALVAGQLLPTSYYALDPGSGEVDQTFVSYWASGAVSAITTYCANGDAWLTRYNEDGTALDQHFFKDGMEVPLPENTHAPHMGSVSNG